MKWCRERFKLHKIVILADHNIFTTIICEKLIKIMFCENIMIGCVENIKYSQQTYGVVKKTPC